MDKDSIQLKTKVSPEQYARLEAICKQYGYTIFKMLRMLSDCIVRFMDDRHNMSDELKRIIRMFEDLPGWRKSICLADDTQELGIVEAFYVIASKRHKGFRLVHVERPMMDGDSENWTSTYNVQRMLERFIELTNPSLYKHLRQLAVDLGTESIFDAIHVISDFYMENPDEKELRLQFEDNDWHQGAQMHEESHRKRGYSHDMDYIETHPTLFDERPEEEPENEDDQEDNQNEE